MIHSLARQRLAQTRIISFDVLSVAHSIPQRSCNALANHDGDVLYIHETHGGVRDCCLVSRSYTNGLPSLEIRCRNAACASGGFGNGCHDHFMPCVNGNRRKSRHVQTDSTGFIAPSARPVFIVYQDRNLCNAWRKSRQRVSHQLTNCIPSFATNFVDRRCDKNLHLGISPGQ
ncbi:hypothetical protein Mal15_18000 [Stieleria maiorica]|uniref:Uncharacterized protein n=1 Tax=Stieleria maiorica TaxID=2795974 RepID=A0A5B9MC22_9BACT|nr:hypothetical protein Mal15_18000 [Stieleria maiorica]